MSTFSGELCRLLAERGMSQRELARRANYDCGFVNKLCRGTRPATPEVARRLDEVLDAGGALMALVNRRQVLAGAAAIAGMPLLGALDADAQERLTWAQRHPPRIDPSAVDVLADLLAAQYRADDLFGSAVTLQPTMAHIAAVENILKQARGPVRPSIVDVAQQWAQFAAYQHRQIGAGAGDRARLAQALEWATEIGDRTMTATVLINRGEAALLAGDAGTVTGLAQAARLDMAAAIGTRAHAADLEARGHAMAGDAAAAERCLGDAAELAAMLPPSSRARTRWTCRHDRHPWLYWLSSTDMHCKRGVSFGYLAADPRYRDLAVAELEGGYAALPEEQRLTAWAAKYPAYLAVVHNRAGDIDQACARALQVAEIARRTGPSLAQRLARQVRVDVQARYPNHARVAELAEALR